MKKRIPQKSNANNTVQSSFMKRVLFGLLLFCSFAHAQDTNFAWAKGIGSTTSSDIGRSVAVDNLGNVYTTGSFTGTADFDPGAGVFNLTAVGGQDIFISKLDASGNFVWAKQIGSTSTESGYGIAVDASGNVYVTGSFQAAANFDPNGVFVLTPVGGTDIFVIKLDTEGNFVWAKNMGGSGVDVAYGIAVDVSGNIYTTGSFQGDADFDPSAGVSYLTTAGALNIFISKLDASGNFIWAKNMGGISSDIAYGIAIDTLGNVYTTGGFQGTADFDPGAGVSNLIGAAGGAYDIFISKLDASGNFVWAKKIGAVNLEYGYGIAVDAIGNVYTTGYFQGTVDFDPNAGVSNLTGSGSANEIFISKLDTSGNFVWAKKIGATGNDIGYGIAVDTLGNVYTTGYFNGTVDFDPNAGVSNLIGSGNLDVFISKLDASGNFVWANKIGGTSIDIGYGIALDASGNVYTTGSFTGTVDFDPNAGVSSLTSIGGNDIFVHRLNQTNTLAGGLNFDGSNDNVTVANVPALEFSSSDVTLEAMVKLNGSQPNYAGIITKATAGANKGIQLVLVNNTLTLEISDGTTTFFGFTEGFETIVNLNDGAWHHVAVIVTRQINNVSLYVDGSLEASVYNNAIGTLDFSTTTPLFIGKDRTSSLFLNGSIDEVRVWNRALCAAELGYRSNCELQSNQTGLVLHHKYNSGFVYANNATNTTVTDASGNNNTGTLNNFSLSGATSNWTLGAVTTGVSCTYETLDATLSATNVLCNGGTDATATAVATGGSEPYSYSWSPSGGNAATATGLAAGTYTCTITSDYCPVTRTIVITEPAVLTNTTTQTSCDTYFWSATGVTYTTSGVYTGTTTNVNGCTVNETLNLTINNGSTTSETITACDTYTWSANGATYTASGVYTNTTTNASGCPNVETLNLTITPYTYDAVFVQACGSYYWPVTGVTYTTVGTNLYEGTPINCVIPQLILELSPISTFSSSVTACNLYTWEANNQIYTQSGTYTYTEGCYTQTLNLTIQSLITYYADADNDGFGNPAMSVQSCVSVPGYVTNGTDCNDTNPAINPAAIDICLDGIDNDCNGNIDNVGLPGGCVPTLTTLPSAQCGSTIASLSVTINATYIVGAQGYRFKITNLVTNVVNIVDRPVNSFALSSIPGITLATPYQVEVALKFNNVWQPFYGTPCSLSTPNPVATIGAQCGTTLTAMNQFVYATYVPNVTGYRFRVTNLTTNQVQITSQGLNRFNFNQLPNRTYNTTYSVEVALKNTDGTYLPYNVACNITTPLFPTSEVRTSQCDYAALSNTEIIVATVVSGVTQYRFKVFNTPLGYEFTVDRPTNTFNLNMFPGLVAGETYSVQVAVQIGGEFGSYGKVCSLTTPGLARANTPENVKVSDAFVAVAYPNPFAENFMLDIKTSSEETIQIRVYDMLGKLVENRKLATTEIENVEVGANYPSGVYNVIVSQGENIQTVRVIKR